jgi:hypothetical protein
VSSAAIPEAPASENFLKTLIRGWDWFWFRPSDPTVLAVVRILVGLIGLYVHYAYTYDLDALFGKDAWLSQAAMDEFRTEVPYYDRRPGWDDESGDIMQPPLPAGELDKDPERKSYMKRWDGSDPHLAYAKGHYAFSIWFFVTDPFWMRVVHFTVLVLFVLLTLGVCTRLVTVLCWLAALSYVQRHYTAFFGMDTILSFVLLYLMIGPAGAALSVDRLIRRYVNAWRALRARSSGRKAGSVGAEELKKAEGLELDRPEPQVSANLALRLIQVHICIVYMASGLSKLLGPSWWNGRAVWYTMCNPEFSPLGSEFYVSALRWLCEHRGLFELFVGGSVLLTLIFEIGFPSLVWNRYTRWLVMMGAVSLHTGIAFFMGLATFSLIMVAAVCSFTPTEALQRFLRWLTYGKGAFRLGYAPRDRKQVRSASLVRTFDVWNQVHVLDHATLHSEAEQTNGVGADARLELVTEKGDVLTGYPMFERLTRSIHLLWPVGAVTFIPGFATLGQTWFPGETKLSGLPGERRNKDKVREERITR